MGLSSCCGAPSCTERPSPCGKRRHDALPGSRLGEIIGSVFNRSGVLMATNTVRFHRVLRAPPERVYRAFLDADAMAKWLPPDGFSGKVHHLDARVGGTYRMSFTNFTTGKSHSFGGEYVELTPHE